MSGYPMPSGDPAALRGFADQLDGGAGRMGELAGNTGTVLSDVRYRAEWTGTAADAYSQFSMGLSSGLARAQQPLAGIAGAVRDYAAALESAQRQVSAANAARDVAQLASAGDPLGAAPYLRAAADAGQRATIMLGDLAVAAGTAARRISSAADELGHLFNGAGPAHSWLEQIHAAWDVTGDGPLAGLTALAEAAPGKLLGLYDEVVQTVAMDFDHGDASYEDIAAAYARYLEEAAGTERLAGSLSALRVLETGLDIVAVPGDISTIGDSGQSAAVRVVAGANLGLATTSAGFGAANLLGAEVAMPGPGTVAFVVTSGFLGADYLYHNWSPFHDAVDAGASVVDDIVNELGSRVHPRAHPGR